LHLQLYLLPLVFSSSPLLVPIVLFLLFTRLFLLSLFYSYFFSHLSSLIPLLSSMFSSYSDRFSLIFFSPPIFSTALPSISFSSFIFSFLFPSSSSSSLYKLFIICFSLQFPFPHTTCYLLHLHCLLLLKILSFLLLPVPNHAFVRSGSERVNNVCFSSTSQYSEPHSGPRISTHVRTHQPPQTM
jgi:hypothetical protein